MNRSRVGILPARKYIETGKMPVPRQDAHSTARCLFHKTLKIIPLLSNAHLLGSLSQMPKFWYLVLVPSKADC
ncbi:MAG: hypothetical protein F6K26_48375 [Moorea sp. SIO2I5]|nr:hypothetical protein [Moorena sp. SIO2I5]